MPAMSGKQYRYFQAHRKDAGKVGQVAEDFIHATPPEKRRKWARPPNAFQDIAARHRKRRG